MDDRDKENMLEIIQDLEVKVNALQTQVVHIMRILKEQEQKFSIIQTKDK